jgi:hypothetical protein
MRVQGLILAVCLSCADDRTTQTECDAISAEIRDLAAKRGINSQGVCSSTNPIVQQDFGEKCRRLKDCQDRCCSD